MQQSNSNVQAVEHQPKPPPGTAPVFDQSYHASYGVRLATLGPAAVLTLMKSTNALSQAFHRRLLWLHDMKVALQHVYRADAAVNV